MDISELIANGSGNIISDFIRHNHLFDVYETLIDKLTNHAINEFSDEYSKALFVGLAEYHKNSMCEMMKFGQGIDNQNTEDNASVLGNDEHLVYLNR